MRNLNKGSVATLDDVAHQHRKKMFMSLMYPELTAQLINNIETSWGRYFLSQSGNDSISLFDAIQEILLKAVCDWTGIPSNRVDIKERTREVAAVELLNIIRPTVATARFVLFAALALYENPRCVKKLQTGDKKYLWCFAQEVRRFYPFLDNNAFNFIPQGGGDYLLGHRCAGEYITLAILERSIDLLVNQMDYEVEKHDYSIDMSRMPALPKHDFIIRGLQ